MNNLAVATQTQAQTQTAQATSPAALKAEAVAKTYASLDFAVESRATEADAAIIKNMIVQVLNKVGKSEWELLSSGAMACKAGFDKANDDILAASAALPQSKKWFSADTLVLLG